MKVTFMSQKVLLTFWASKWVDMAKTKTNFMFNVAILVFCNLVTKILGAVFRIPLLKILGSQGLGLYQLVFPLYAFMLVISSSGISVALSKFVSKAISVQNYKLTKRYLKCGFFISLFVSLLCSVLFVAISPLLAKYQGNAGLVYCYWIIFPSIIFSSLSSTLRGYFLGKNEMAVTGGMQIVGQASKLILSLIFASYFKTFGLIYSVAGAVLGVTVSELFSFLLFGVVYFSKRKDTKRFGIDAKVKKNEEILPANSNIFKKKIFLCAGDKRNPSSKTIVWRLFKFAFFVSLQACIIPLTGAVDSAIVVPLLVRSGLNGTMACTLFGLEDGIVSSLVNMPTVVATSIGVALVPNIKLDADNHIVGEQNVSESIKLVWLIGIACAFAYAFFARDIVSFLYSGGLGGKVVQEIDVLENLIKINAFNIVYLSLLSLSTSILQGIGKSKIPVINLGICAFLRLLLLCVLISVKNLNIYATALVDMVFYSLSFILNMVAIKKWANFSFGLGKIFVLPAMCCFAMCFVMKLFKISLSGLISTKIVTIIMVLVGIATYFSLLAITKVLNIKKLLSSFKQRRQSK